MADELNPLEENPLDQAALDALETPEPVTPAVPAFDADAERAKIRAEEADKARAEFAPRPNVPTGPDELEAAIEAFDIKRALEINTERTIEKVMGTIGGDINRLRQDQVVSDLSSGLGDHGRAYIRKLSPLLNPGSLTDELRDVVTSAAKFKDIQANPDRMRPEPAYSQPGAISVNKATLDFFMGKGFTQAEVTQMVKDGEVPQL